MMPAYSNRGMWKADDELEMMAVLRALGLDELRAAKRLIGREIHRRELEGPELHVVTDAERQLFRNA